MCVSRAIAGQCCPLRVIRYRSGLVEMSASASSGHLKDRQDILALAGQLLVQKVEIKPVS
jgi:hypothetical protein